MLCKGTVEEKLRLCFDLYDVEKTGMLNVEHMILMAGSLCEIYQNKVHQSNMEVVSTQKFRSVSSDVTQTGQFQDEQLVDRYQIDIYLQCRIMVVV